MGWQDSVDSFGDAVTSGIESAVEAAGELIDSGLDVVADGARAAGADGVGGFVDDLGDRIVDATGGEPTERELGQTRDPKELVRGEPSAIDAAVQALVSIGRSIETTGDALHTIDTGGWAGDAASAFHDEYGKQPRLWWQGSDAMGRASTALQAWFFEVGAAQARAAEAIAVWDEAEREEQARKDVWNALSDDRKRDTELVDTWTTLREQAREILRDARTQRDNAASVAAAALAAATDLAPTEPPFLQRWGSNFADIDAAFQYAKQNFASGLLTSLTGIVGFVRSVNPGDVYNATHPGEYLASVSEMSTGLVVAAADPGATVGALWDGVKANPTEALGALTGDAVLTIATGGAGAAKPALSALERVDDIADAGRIVERIDGASPPRLPDRPDTPSSSAEPAHQTPSPSAAPEPAHTTPAVTTAETPGLGTSSSAPDTATRANESTQGASPTSPDRPGDQGSPPAQPESTRSPDDNAAPPHGPRVATTHCGTPRRWRTRDDSRIARLGAQRSGSGARRIRPRRPRRRRRPSGSAPRFRRHSHRSSQRRASSGQPSRRRRPGGAQRHRPGPARKRVGR